jgi:hypothetical protein
MRLALMFRQCQQRRIPGVGPLARGVVDGEPGVVANLRAGDALGLIFMEDRRPNAVQINLGEYGLR